MWVSRHRFEQLERRVRELENDRVTGVEGVQKVPTLGHYVIGWRDPGISAAAACKALAQHLGVKFRVAPAQKPEVVVEKAGKSGVKK